MSQLHSRMSQQHSLEPSTGRINGVLHPRSSFARCSRQHNHSGSESDRGGHQHICLFIFMVILHTLIARNFQLCTHFLTKMSFFTLVQCVGATINIPGSYRIPYPGSEAIFLQLRYCSSASNQSKTKSKT